MRLEKAIDKSTLTAVTTLLQPSFSGITPEKLMDALTSYEETPKKKSESLHRPLTRKEVSELLKVSLPTVNRMLNDGRLKRIKMSDSQNGTVRIEYSSVERMITGD